MKTSGNWKQIETLPARPGVAVMTSSGYWLDGRFYPTGSKREVRRAGR